MRPKKVTKQELWDILKNTAPESITWNHYDLAENTPIKNPEIWKQFLTEQDVVDWVKDEQALLQRYELAKLSTDVSNSRSVGQAQLISAMERVNANNETASKKGPIFIYTYVPLNKEQQFAENVDVAPYDLFLKTIENEEINDVPEFTFD